MNKTIILSELSKTIAELTQCTDADAENFVRELFALVAERLETDGEAYIPEVGTFKVVDETLNFVPTEDLAAAINAPFAAFEAIEIPEDFSIEEDEEIEATVNEELDNVSDVAITETQTEPESSPQVLEQIEPKQTSEPEIASEPESISDYLPQPEENEEAKSASDYKRGHHHWILWLIACAVCFAAGWYCGHSHSTSSTTVCQTTDENIITTIPDTVSEIVINDDINSDTITNIIELPTETVPTVIKDTIAAGRFLTTMARQHYGQMDYWVYIYEENAANLGHPDRLSAGTVVIIPSAEKYGLIAGDKAKIKEASRLATEIYARFN